MSTKDNDRRSHLNIQAMANRINRPEQEAINDVQTALCWTTEQHQQTTSLAAPAVTAVRAYMDKQGPLAELMHRYSLTSQEGLALMCLAEAFIRVPDAATQQQLLLDQLAGADWLSEQNPSGWLSQTVAWSLNCAGQMFESSSVSVVDSLKRVGQRLSGPVMRQATQFAMQRMGGLFVLAEDIDKALKAAKGNQKKGYTYSFDMLGEAAYTESDAERYFKHYWHAIEQCGAEAVADDALASSGVSVKLSALCPKYDWQHRDYCVPKCQERLLQLAQLAQKFNILLTVDAEEYDRLELSLAVIQGVYANQTLAGWGGLGLAVQAYQKAAQQVLEACFDWVERVREPLHIRLVKGAYWDSEIKHAQQGGHGAYPVWTRKVHTDINYMACVKLLLSAPEEVYPMFATHNAYTAAAVMVLNRQQRACEFQCLHGMGEPLYHYLLERHQVHCRIYAPVGRYRELLPYLVRRLLENGANSSFVHQLAAEQAGRAELLENPLDQIAEKATSVMTLPLPKDLYQPLRVNARGAQMAASWERQAWREQYVEWMDKQWDAVSSSDQDGVAHAAFSPVDRSDQVGRVTLASESTVQLVLQQAEQAWSRWRHVSVAERADMLQRFAEQIESHAAELMVLLQREAGKTIQDAIDEVREAVDFCRYYAVEAVASLSPRVLPGPTGERNEWRTHGRGVVVCISPWNFPLAIFCGQVVAALVAGNVVIAKPAEQTSCIAVRLLECFHAAGLPQGVCQCLVAKGRMVGPVLFASHLVQAVMFTGSTAVARQINQALAKREDAIVPLIAETGGQNAMLVDSTALAEQVVRDVMASAFGSAGQRCSALRVLYVQDEVYDGVIKMLQGAMACSRVGNPLGWSVDLGPMIDQAAVDRCEQHVAYLERIGQCLGRIECDQVIKNKGYYFSPCAYAIDSITQLSEEVFGPVLHVVRYSISDLDTVLAEINATGFGLTFGVHTRIASRAALVAQQISAGNVYVNRNMVGAVVGVQPFGGHGLSGTGPKAGGPHYLPRLCVEQTVSTDTTASGGDVELLSRVD